MSTIGTRVSGVAYPLIVLAITGSAAQAGLVAAAQTAPFLIWFVPAGALVDRWPRKRIMLAADAGRAVALASVAVAVQLGQVMTGYLMGVVFAEGTLYVFFLLAETAALPYVVPRARLPAAVVQMAALALAPTVFWLGVVYTADAPPMGPVFQTANAAYRYALTPGHLQGRVYGISRMTGWCTVPLGALLGGISLQTLGAVPTFAALATCLAIVAAPRRRASRSDGPQGQNAHKPENVRYGELAGAGFRFRKIKIKIIDQKGIGFPSRRPGPACSGLMARSAGRKVHRAGHLVAVTAVACPGLRRHQRPAHLYIEVAGRRIRIAVDLPARAGQPVSVRLAPLAHRPMSVTYRGDRAGVGRGGNEAARKH